ncbi:cation:proton antiporter [Amnibacterium flavum]|uniref:Cation:proton antiporter n=1 Tax=Amnibacterium flavum TaxID=2173173 RepID=A0A2V1HTI0_9MICO|nr:sodium:proton antiporter [Amnibacterium flavum]PVZ94280.1 cation:proton antiporter [Amnibacterium flavum]
MEPIIFLVLALLTIAGVTALSSKAGVASPLVLVGVGIAVSFLPFVPAIEIEPEWILAGVLPPLLYSAAVSMPSMDFRREFGAISGLSVVLVVASSVVLGVVFAALIPGLGLAWGIALGAIVSPTDAVATSIVKRLGVSPRVTTILEGESLLNDATALVLLRAAVAGAAASISLWQVAGQFVVAVVVAVVIGFLVGRLNLVVRARITDPTVNTVLSFTVPFLASIPAELLGGSGLVAAVAAGIVTGRLAPRKLSPQHRLSDTQNWRTIELVLEGAVFLLMGLQLFGIVEEVEEAHAGALTAVGIAALALLLTIAVRTAFVSPLLVLLKRRAARSARLVPRLTAFQDRLAQRDDPTAPMLVPAGPGGRGGREGRGRRLSESQLAQFSTRVRRGLADIDYLLAAPLGWREGSVVVWAGMRGAVTLAAAQTLPTEAPARPLLVLIAFLVAAGSLAIQGGSLAWFVRLVKPAVPDPAAAVEERGRILELLDESAVTAATDAGFPPAPGARIELTHLPKSVALTVIDAQRTMLLDARDDGAFASDLLAGALASLDADQLNLMLKGGPDDSSEGGPKGGLE